jgi:hypothetical protein
VLRWYLTNVSVEELATARQNENAFLAFRKEMDEALAEYAELDPESQIAARDRIIRDTIRGPVAKVTSDLKTLRRNVWTEAGLAVGVFGATFASVGTWFGAAAGLAGLAMAMKAGASYKEEKERQDAIRLQSAFFFWDATQASREL